MLFAEGKWGMLQNSLIPNISLSVNASVMSRVNSLAWFHFAIWLNTRSDAGYEIFSLTKEINNYLGIIPINLIILGLFVRRNATYI